MDKKTLIMSFLPDFILSPLCFCKSKKIALPFPCMLSAQGFQYRIYFLFKNLQRNQSDIKSLVGF